MTAEARAQLIQRMNEIAAAGGEPSYQFKTIPQGAATSVWAGVVAKPGEVGGRYCQDCHVAEVTGAGREASLRRARLCPRPGARHGAVGEKRGDGRRAVLNGAGSRTRGLNRHREERSDVAIQEAQGFASLAMTV